MKLIAVPDDVTLMNFSAEKPFEDGGVPLPPISMGRFLLVHVFTDPKFTKERKDRRAIHVLRKKFLEARSGDVVEVEDDHCERLKRMVETYEPTMNAVVMEQFIPFEDAILNARDKEG